MAWYNNIQDCIFENLKVNLSINYVEPMIKISTPILLRGVSWSVKIYEHDSVWMNNYDEHIRSLLCHKLSANGK